MTADCTTLSSTIDDLNTIINSGVDQVQKTANTVVNAATNELKARAKDAVVYYATEHPMQTRFAAASSILVFSGAVAGLLAFGYIIAQQNK